MNLRYATNNCLVSVCSTPYSEQTYTNMIFDFAVLRLGKPYEQVLSGVSVLSPARSPGVKDDLGTDFPLKGVKGL